MGRKNRYPILAGRGKARTKKQEAANMRGYFTAAGFYGLVDGRYMLFAGEAEYYEWAETDENEEDAS